MNQSFTRGSRTRMLAIVILLIAALFIVRLFYIQVIRHSHYVSQADNEQIKQFKLSAKRGELYAMDGGMPVKLVMNETVYTVWADPTQVEDKDEIISALSSIAGGNMRKNARSFLDNTRSRYQVLATKVSRKQAEMLKDKKLAGIGFDAVSQRVYPEGSLASQVLGFVDAEGEGKYGFEQANDARLKGKDGLLKTVTDIRSVPLTVGDKNINIPAQDGDDIALSIDRSVQAKVEQILAEGVKKSNATHASAVVVDPQTGKVLAMANVPTYDPSKLHEASDPAVFNNNTISQPYEPGSDIKTFTVATGIDKGVITPASTYNNTDKIQVDDAVIGNASKGQTGTITMQHALNWSLNTGMVTIVQRLGDGNRINRAARDTIYDYFHNRFRLGQSTGIELANEASGVIIPPTHAEGNAVRYSNVAFGQGMDATMIQVASGFGALVNGGIYREPSVIEGVVDENGKLASSTQRPQHPGVITKASSDTVREMVHQSHYATYNPHDGSDKYYVGGKTGTSQTIVNGKYVSNQTIGTYLGFGGEKGELPRYVIMVEISGAGKNMGGGSDAKPMFNAISNWMITHLKLVPKG